MNWQLQHAAHERTAGDRERRYALLRGKLARLQPAVEFGSRKLSFITFNVDLMVASEGMQHGVMFVQDDDRAGHWRLRCSAPMLKRCGHMRRARGWVRTATNLAASGCAWRRTYGDGTQLQLQLYKQKRQAPPRATGSLGIAYLDVVNDRVRVLVIHWVGLSLQV